MRRKFIYFFYEKFFFGLIATGFVTLSSVQEDIVTRDNLKQS
jgi:hypothetical protein